MFATNQNHRAPVCSALSILLFLFSIAVPAASQENKFLHPSDFFLDVHLLEAVAPKHPNVSATDFPREAIDSTLDVLEYELWTDWTMALTTSRDKRPDRKAESRILLRCKIIDNIQPLITSITLNARTVIIDSVLVDGERTTFNKMSSTLEIDLPKAVTGGDRFDVDIYYAMASDVRGFHAYSQAEVDTVEFLLEPIAFTFNQPLDAQRWYPCNDLPHDKALFTVHCRVPKGFTVVSNGERIDSTSDTDSTNWQTWHHPLPMSTYLFTLNASRFHYYEQEFESVSGQTIPIYNYHWLADHNGTQYNAVNALEPIPSMFASYEARFGAYRFPTYGHVTIAPIFFGGMEHQSMSSINRRWLEGRAAAGYAHEVAHQWIGDQVTCATWADIWLNEGGASWSEALWLEDVGGYASYISHLNVKRDRYMENGLDEPPVYDIPLFMLFNEATTYNKSAWVYHQIRVMEGERFFAALRSYIKANDLGVAQTADFLEFLKNEIPDPVVNWDTYFDQWLIRQGHPQYAGLCLANNIEEPGGYRNNVFLNQVQQRENVPMVFEMPVTIRFYGVNTWRDTTIMMNSRSMRFSFYTPWITDSIEIDPLDDILCEKSTSTIVSVASDNAQEQIAAAPVPVVRGETVTISAPPSSVIRCYSITGELLEVQTNDAESVAFVTDGWPSGVAVVIVEHNQRFTSITIPVVR